MLPKVNGWANATLSLPQEPWPLDRGLGLPSCLGLKMVFSLQGDGSTWVLLCLLPTYGNSSHSLTHRKGCHTG